MSAVNLQKCDITYSFPSLFEQGTLFQWCFLVLWILKDFENVGQGLGTMKVGVHQGFL